MVEVPPKLLLKTRDLITQPLVVRGQSIVGRPQFRGLFVQHRNPLQLPQPTLGGGGAVAGPLPLNLKYASEQLLQESIAIYDSKATLQKAMTSNEF